MAAKGASWKAGRFVPAKGSERAEARPRVATKEQVHDELRAKRIYGSPNQHRKMAEEKAAAARKIIVEIRQMQARRTELESKASSPEFARRMGRYEAEKMARNAKNIRVHEKLRGEELAKLRREVGERYRWAREADEKLSPAARAYFEAERGPRTPPTFKATRPRPAPPAPPPRPYVAPRQNPRTAAVRLTKGGTVDIAVLTDKRDSLGLREQERRQVPSIASKNGLHVVKSANGKGHDVIHGMTGLAVRTGLSKERAVGFLKGSASGKTLARYLSLYEGRPSEAGAGRAMKAVHRYFKIIEERK
jgi:hypothetical protein